MFRLLCLLFLLCPSVMAAETPSFYTNLDLIQQKEELPTPIILLPGTPMACRPYPALVGVLKREHHESLKGTGIVTDKIVMELWSSSAGTFTTVFHFSSGMGCILTIGVDWTGGV